MSRWTLSVPPTFTSGAVRHIGAELGVHWSTIGQQLQSVGITMRRGGPSAHPVFHTTDPEGPRPRADLAGDSSAGRYDGFRRLEPLPESPTAQVTTLCPLPAFFANSVPPSEAPAVQHAQSSEPLPAATRVPAPSRAPQPARRRTREITYKNGSRSELMVSSSVPATWKSKLRRSPRVSACNPDRQPRPVIVAVRS